MAKNIDFNGLCNAIAQIDEAFVENTAKAINKNVTARNWLTPLPPILHGIQEFGASGS